MFVTFCDQEKPGKHCVDVVEIVETKVFRSHFTVFKVVPYKKDVVGKIVACDI